MTVTVQHGFVQEIEADAVVVNLFKGVRQPGGATGAVDRVLDGAITDLIAAGDFEGRLGDTAVLYTRGAMPAPRVILVGLGEQGKFDLETVRKAAAAAARRAKGLGVTRLATIVHGAGVGGLDPEDAAQATVEGSLLALYEFRELKTEEEEERKGRVAELVVVEAAEERLEAVQVSSESARGCTWTSPLQPGLTRRRTTRRKVPRASACGYWCAFCRSGRRVS